MDWIPFFAMYRRQLPAPLVILPNTRVQAARAFHTLWRHSTMTCERSSRSSFSIAQRQSKASLAGHGLAYLLEDMARAYIEREELVQVLIDWCPPFPGYRLYYPSRRQASPTFAAVVDALKYIDALSWQLDGSRPNRDLLSACCVNCRLCAGFRTPAPAPRTTWIASVRKPAQRTSYGARN